MRNRTKIRYRSLSEFATRLPDTLKVSGCVPADNPAFVSDDPPG